MSSPTQLKPLGPQEWESLIDDYNHGGVRLARWTSTNYTGFNLFELALSSLSRKDLPLNLKLHLLVFLEEHCSAVIPATTAPAAFIRLNDTLRSVVQSPNDGVSITFAFKEQFIISTTSIFVTTNTNGESRSNTISSGLVPQFECLIELLLTIINRPNHSVDRQTRSVACDCLRELEISFPCLLSGIVSQLWILSQSERTHSGQGYALLLTTAVSNIVKVKPNDSFTNASMPLVPFNVPSFLIDDGDSDDNPSIEKQISDSSIKDLKRVVAFLLEWPHNLTPWGLLEFMDKILPVAAALDLQASLLKVQFSGLLSTYDPLLWHAFLSLYLRFKGSFRGQELEIARRLLLLSKESQNHLVFRLLVLHWLLGFIAILIKSDEGKKGNVLEMSLNFYPSVFDPLALKALKLDLLAYCSVLVDNQGNGAMSPKVSMVKLFDDALFCVSAFKWLPPWSTETAVAFRAFHKFLVGSSSHSETVFVPNRVFTESPIFHALQKTLVATMSDNKGIVPAIITFIDRLLACHRHHLLGERLLMAFDEHLLSKLKLDYRLGSYFPVLEKIAESSKVSPRGLIELLTKFVTVLVEKHGPDTGLRSWCHGSKVLGICRTMLMHHCSSKLFLGLSRLLAFICLYFPDLEVRDNARIYLRMLICVPGKKLRDILNSGDHLPGVSQSSSYFTLHSPRFSRDLKKSKDISSYIHLERAIPLLVKQSWSLSFPTTTGFDSKKPSYLEPISEPRREADRSADHSETFQTNTLQTEPLRVLDSKISQIVETLRKYFSSIPDFRHMPGFRIKIHCLLWFESEPFRRVWVTETNRSDQLPAMYATVLSFSSSAPYGSIPSCHIPFLIGQQYPSIGNNSLDIVPVGEVGGGFFRTPVVIELEPRDPVPGLVDVFVEANTINSQIIKGQLRNVTVGIEDMFLKAVHPDDISRDAMASYYMELFNALWEACGPPASTGRETFLLKGGKGAAAISGTQSVKLLEVPAVSLIQAIERCLAPFVVSVTGEPLINILRDGDVIRDIVWGDITSDSSKYLGGGPLYLKYLDNEEDEDEDPGEGSAVPPASNKRNMGCIQILVFLPPRFHLLFQMEVCDASTLVRIRTDHWPCLAYVDDYLEALFCS